MDLSVIAREVGKFAAVIAVAAVGGLGLGIALAEVRGVGDSGPPPGRASSASERGQVRVQVLSATLLQAQTRAGRRRGLARVTVRARVTNGSADALPASDPVFLSGGTTPVDPRNRAAAGDLLQPLDPGDSATGELRFELVGDATKRVRTDRRGQLRIAGNSVDVRLRSAPSGS